jgi:hypothetical protein
VYCLLDFYLKFRFGGVERQRPSRPCKSRNKPTGSLRNQERHSIMQLLGAKNDTVEPNRAEPWSAFSEGQAHPLLRFPSGSGVSLHLGGGVGSGPRTTRQVAAPHQPANIHESRRPKHVDFGPRLDSKVCQIYYAKFLFSVTSKCRHIYRVLNIDEIKNNYTVLLYFARRTF